MREIVIVCLIYVIACLITSAARVALPSMAKAIVSHDIAIQNAELQRVLEND